MTNTYKDQIKQSIRQLVKFPDMPIPISRFINITTDMDDTILQDLVASVLATFQGHGVVFDQTEFWKHSLGVAVASQSLTAMMGYPRPHIAFISGFLHDIGKIILDEYAPQIYDKIVYSAQKNGILIYDLEKSILGFTHTEVGDWLSIDWAFPEELATAIATHHTPHLAKSHQKLVQIVHSADIFCRAINIGSAGDHQIPSMAANIWRTLHLTETTLTSLLAEMDQKFEAASFLLKPAK